MDSTAQNLQQPRIERTLTYRSQVRGMYFVLLGSAPLLFCLCAYYAIQGSLPALFAFSIPLFNVLAAHFWLKPSVFTKVFLTQHGITLDRRGDLTEVPFYKIEAVKFSFLPYLGGWFVLRTNDGGAHRFTAGLERSDYLLDALAIAQPTLVPTAELARYRRISIVIDHVFARLQHTFGEWPSLIALQLALPLVLTAVVFIALSAQNFTEAPLVFASLGLVNSLVALLIWLPKEVIEMRTKDSELLNNPLNPLRNLARERKQKSVARAVHLLLMFAFVFWVCGI